MLPVALLGSVLHLFCEIHCTATYVGGGGGIKMLARCNCTGLVVPFCRLNLFNAGLKIQKHLFKDLHFLDNYENAPKNYLFKNSGSWADINTHSKISQSKAFNFWINIKIGLNVYSQILIFVAPQTGIKNHLLKKKFRILGPISRWIKKHCFKD